MKKIFLFALAFMAFSCNDELDQVSPSIVNNSDVMSFSAGFEGTSTRAAECQSLNAFSIGAYVGDTEYIAVQTATKDATCTHSFGPSYKLADTYYWPNNVPVTFRAAATTDMGITVIPGDTILPGKVVTNSVPTIDNTGIHFENWTFGATNWADQQRDPVAAAKTQTVKWDSQTGVLDSTDGDCCVDLTFYHLLSRIGICGYFADTKATETLSTKIIGVKYNGLYDKCSFAHAGDITGKYDYSKTTQDTQALTADEYTLSGNKINYVVTRNASAVSYLERGNANHQHTDNIKPLAPYAWSNTWPAQHIDSLTLTVEVYNKKSETLIDTQNVTLTAVFDDNGNTDPTDDTWIPLSDLDNYQPGYGYLYCVRISLVGDPDTDDPDDPNPDDPGDIKLKAVAICAIVDPWTNKFVGYLGKK